MPNVVTIPPHWQNVTWHHDACESWIAARGPWGALKVWVDKEDPEARECDGHPRFAVTFLDADEDPTELLASDDWAEVLAFVALYVGLRG